ERESLLEDGRLDRGAASAVADDATRDNCCAGERVNVTDRVHRSVVQSEQGRLGAVVKQHADTTTRNEMVVCAGDRPHLNVVEKCHSPSLVIGGPAASQ